MYRSNILNQFCKTPQRKTQWEIPKNNTYLSSKENLFFIQQKQKAHIFYVLLLKEVTK